MTSENKEVCTQCPNHCPISDLKCGRGRRAMLGEGQEHGEMREHGEGSESPSDALPHHQALP